MRGYYEDSADEFSKDSRGRYQVFIYFGDGEGYSPDGHEMNVDNAYAKECNRISKEEYLKRTEGLYTPVDYLDEVE